MKKLILPALALFVAYNLFGKSSDETTVVIDEPTGKQPGDVVQKPNTDDLKNMKPVSVRPAAQSPARISPTGNELLLHNNQTRVIP